MDGVIGLGGMHGGGESVLFAGRYGDSLAHFEELFVAADKGERIWRGDGGVGTVGSSARAHDGEGGAGNGDLGCGSEAEEYAALEIDGWSARGNSLRSIDWGQGIAGRAGGRR